MSQPNHPQPDQPNQAQPHPYQQPGARAVPTGALSWVLQLIAIAVFPLSTIAAVIATAIIHGSTAKRWPQTARANAAHSLNWAISHLIYSLLLIGAHIIVMIYAVRAEMTEFSFSMAIAISLWVLLGIYHVIMMIVCLKRAGRGQVASVPGAIRFVRAR